MLHTLLYCGQKNYKGELQESVLIGRKTEPVLNKLDEEVSELKEVLNGIVTNSS